MKLIYSSSHKGRLFKGNNSSKNRYIESLQLLTILERELGLFSFFSSDEERIKKYVKALDLNKQNSFYEKSFNNDNYKVAKELLLIRDELVYSGWDTKLENQPKRFEDFVKVEKDFISQEGYEGTVDRWLNVYNDLCERSNLSFDFELHVIDDPNFINPLFNKIFNKLNAVFIESNFNVQEFDNNLAKFKSVLINSYNINSNTNQGKVEFIPFNKDSSLVVLKFPNKQVLIDSIAAVSDTKNDIIIGEDLAEFDISLVSYSKNATGSIQKQSNPQIIQLFKLIVSCFSKFDLHTFVSFLQLSYSPIPYKLRKDLLNLIIEKPGIGNEEWLKKIEHFKCDDENEKSQRERNKIIELFLTFENSSESDSVAKAKEIVNYLISWTSSMIHSTNEFEIKEQISYLNTLFRRVQILIEDCQDILSVEKAFNTVYEPFNFTNYKKQQDSIHAVSDFSKISSVCNNAVINIDFYDSFNDFSLSKYLLSEEILYLKSNGIYYDSYEALNVSQQIKGLFNIENKLILCYFEAEDIEKHPFHIRLESYFKESIDLISLEISSVDDLNEIFSDVNLSGHTVTSNERLLPKPLDYFRYENLNFPLRDRESASSIEKFIQYPFDWVLEYQLKMRAYRGLELGNEHQMKGNVAHKIVENILNQFKGERNNVIHVEENLFEAEFRKAIHEEGMLFLQPEKRFELSEFKKKFQISFYALIQFINENKLQIVSCESSFGYEEDFYLDEVGSNVGGYIDLVLKEQDGTFVILDLKWTYSDKKFKSKIENNEAIQLALYSAALNQIENAKTGYYLLKQNQLVTSHHFEGSNIFQIPSTYSTQEILVKIRDSFNYRREEFLSGKIEIGDLIPLDDLAYSGNSNFIQLSETKKCKDTNNYSGFELFKGQLN